MSSQAMHEAFHQALQEVDRQVASGELDGSGRFYTPEELESQRGALALKRKPKKVTEEPAA